MLWRLDVVEGAAQLAQAECQDCVFKNLPAHVSAAQMEETGPGGRTWLLRKLETLEGAARVAYAECEKMYSNSSPSMSLALPRNHRLTEKGPEAPAPVAHTSSQAVPSQAMHRALCGQEDCLHCRPQPAAPVAGIVAKPLVSRGKLPRCLRTRALLRCTSKQTFHAEPQRAALAAAVAGEL